MRLGARRARGRLPSRGGRRGEPGVVEPRRARAAHRPAGHARHLDRHRLVEAPAPDTAAVHGGGLRVAAGMAERALGERLQIHVQHGG